jgi:DNA-binding NarL/FixJ family response regulator
MQMIMHENPVKVLIADNQFLITESLMHILQKDGQFKVIKVISNKHELLKALKLEKVSLLIVDYALIDFNSFKDLTEIKNDFPNVQVLILTNTISKIELLELNSAGIKNIIYKTTNEEELFEAINASLKGKKYYSAELLDMLFEGNEKKGNTIETAQLTNTEIEIVRLVAEGLTTKDIAARKHISFHTVISHRKNIFRKLGVSSASELIMYAIKAGWIDNIEYFI